MYAYHATARVTFKVCWMRSLVVKLLRLCAWNRNHILRTSKTKYPEGWELIEPTLNDLETKMREGAHLSVSTRRQRQRLQLSSVLVSEPMFWGQEPSDDSV